MSGTRAISTTSRRELSPSFFFCKARHRRKFAPFWQTLVCFLPARAKDLSATLHKDACKETRTSSWRIICWAHFWIFFIDIIVSSALGPCSRLNLLTKVSTKHIYWGVRWPVLSADNLTTFTSRLPRASGILNLLQPQVPVEASTGRFL